MADDLAIEQIKRYQSGKSYRETRFDNDAQYIAQYCLPNDSVITTTKTEGVSGWTDLIFDTTAIQAAQVLAAGLFNSLTPQTQPWIEYAPPEELDTEEGDEAAQWLGRASDILMRELGRSNFYLVAGLSHLGRPVFGTDLVLAEEGEDTTLLFHHHRFGTYTIEENAFGLVDACRREFELTARQVRQMFEPNARFPKQKIPESLQNAIKGNNQKTFKFIHCVFPREDSKKLARSAADRKPIASVYISLDAQETCRVSGYDESPILCSRFAKWGTGSPYGYGPGYLCLPDARQVNYMQQFMDQVAELHANPRVLTPSNMDGDVDLRAGGVTTFDPMNPNAVPREWATAADYKLGMDLLEQKRQMIRDAFYNQAFKLLNSQPLLDKSMTAYEISQRLAEQLEQVTPVVARCETEFVKPLGRRCFGILFRSGKLGQPPAALMRQTGPNSQALVMPDVQVTSRFTDALKAIKNRGRTAAIDFALKLATEAQRPDVLDVFELDRTVIGYARDAGMAPDDIRAEHGKNSVQAIRQQRAQMAQQQRAAAMAEQLAKAGKNIGGAPEFMQQQVKDATSGSNGGRAA